MWTSSGNGAGIPGFADNTNESFHFDYQPLSGSGTVTAQLSSINPQNIYGTGGVMIRQNATDQYSPFYYVGDDGANVSVSFRRFEGAAASTVLKVADGTPAYLRILRQGATYTAQTSPDGSSWTTVAGSQVALVMADPVNAGIAISLATVTMTGVSVAATSGSATITNCASPWTCADIGSGYAAGSSATDGGATWALDGTGKYWNLNPSSDNFRYAYQAAGGSGTISTHVNYLANTSCRASAGLMVRGGTASNAQFFSVALVYGNCGNGGPPTISVQDRLAAGGQSGEIATLSVGAEQAWLRITWAGNAFTASYSSDGITWSPIVSGSATIAGASGLVGLFSMDGQGNPFGTAGFDATSFAPPTDLLGGNDPSALPTTCSCGDPVNTATGNFWQTFDDLSIPGRGASLNLSRTYNSLAAAQDGPLGYGWTMSYAMYLSTPGGGIVTVHQENGSAISFACTASPCTAPTWAQGTLVINADGTYTFRRSQPQSSFTFSAPTTSAPGQLQIITDRNGYTTAVTYIGGRLSGVTDPAGRSLTFGYNAGNRIATVTDSAGNRSMTFTYDGAGNLTDVIDVGGGHTHFTYDGHHRLLTVESPRQYALNGAVSTGPVTTNVYDGSGRVITQIDPLGHQTTFGYVCNADGTETTSVADPNGNMTTQTYANYELQSMTKGAGTPQAATWQYTYDASTRGVTSVTDPNGRVSSSTWDGNGNRLTSTDALSHTTTYTYDALNDLTSVTDPNGIKTTLTYDANGNLRTVSKPLTATSQTATTTYNYTDATHPGDVTSVVDPNGHSTTFGYDGYGDVNKVTDAAGNVSTGGYDAVGRVLSEVSPRGNVAGASPAAFTTAFTYNPYGDVLSQTDPLGHKTVAAYDADGNVVTSTDALGNVTTLHYDSKDQLTSEARAESSTLGYGYDAAGNLTSQTNGLQETTIYGYDPLNRVVSVTDPLNRTSKATYDGVGNRATFVDAMNRTTTFHYDAANELSGIVYSDGSTPNVSYTYDADGQRKTMTDGTGTSTYTYDSLNRLTQSVDGSSTSVGYTYDLAGNLTGLTYPGGSQVTRTYDPANRLASVKDWLNHTTTFGYDANSNLSSEAYPNGVTATFGYNNADQLLQIADAKAGTTLFTFGYTRDANGQVITVADSIEGVNHTYGYDALNRFSSDQQTAGSTTWTYDNGDHPTGSALPSGSSTTLTYDAAGQLSSSGFTTSPGGPQPGALATSGFGSRQAGSPVRSRAVLSSFSSTAAARAHSVMSLPRPDVVGQGSTTTSTFTYNADGQRTAQSGNAGLPNMNFYYDQAGSLTEALTPHAASCNVCQDTTGRYSYNGDGLRVQKQWNGSTQAIALATMTWDVAEGLPLLMSDGSTQYVTGPGGLPLEQINGNSGDYFVQDQLGSTRALLSASGTTDATYVYDGYGNVTASSGTVTTPFQYAGQYTDSESGLQYMHARYYDPKTQQFLSVDPLVGQTGQPYAYTGNNPANAVDPSGQFAWELAFAGAGAVIGGGLDAYHQYQQHCGSFDNFNWGEFAGAAVGGALTGAMIGSGVGAVAEIADASVPSAEVAAQDYAASLRATMPRSEWPTTSTAAVDSSTGRVYYGASGNLRGAPSELADVLPAESSEPWSTFNCGEVEACANAVRDGAQLQDLVVHTVRTRTGLTVPPCENCLQWVP